MKIVICVQIYTDMQMFCTFITLFFSCICLIFDIQVEDKTALVQQLDPKKDTPSQVSEILIRVATEELMSIPQTVSLVTIIIISSN